MFCDDISARNAQINEGQNHWSKQLAMDCSCNREQVDVTCGSTVLTRILATLSTRLPRFDGRAINPSDDANVEHVAACHTSAYKRGM